MSVNMPSVLWENIKLTLLLNFQKKAVMLSFLTLYNILTEYKATEYVITGSLVIYTISVSLQLVVI